MMNGEWQSKKNPKEHLQLYCFSSDVPLTSSFSEADDDDTGGNTLVSSYLSCVSPKFDLGPE